MTNPNLSAAVLKPCPHCGGKAKCFQRAYEWSPTLMEWCVFCDTTNCSLGTRSSIKEAAIDAWNRRDAAERGGDCILCERMFPVNDAGEHYGTQSLGMIPTTPCAKEEKPIEISEAILNAADKAYQNRANDFPHRGGLVAALNAGFAEMIKGKS